MLMALGLVSFVLLLACLVILRERRLRRGLAASPATNPHRKKAPCIGF
jgi:hypothetical protein